MTAHMSPPPDSKAGGTEAVLDKSLRYAVSAPKLYELLVSEDAAAHWMGADVIIDPAVGGEIQVSMSGWPEIVGEFLEVLAPERLVVSWQAADWGRPLLSTIEIHTDGPHDSRLSLRESGFGSDDDLLRRRDWLWSHWLVRLAAWGAQRGSVGATPQTAPKPTDRHRC
ncbi:SRPBCC family protein [Candidatus Mycolicibacterium alkanivorans]|uniref:SRPBCC domain-containing protein n=1 Tax=Candidatus Mycolicibacterium alkanivorans TaxID=2954114 RepID=A0ABS9YYX4_9MYCO|nr:SRPBCC domain-containing protein [Candidatus Mycolicibacterium alkanivorans]MCI4676461.1 SRPBCC domain-containing protein [Candidatus Mycolicibacterium alkanivorans]